MLKKKKLVKITFEKQPTSEETIQLIKDFIVFCQKKLKLIEIPHIIFQGNVQSFEKLYSRRSKGK